MATAVYGFKTIDDAENYSFKTLVNAVAQSIEDKMPHRYVTSIAQLDAMSSSTLYPNGMIAVLTVHNGGLRAGSTFVRLSQRWCLMACHAIDLSAFIPLLSSNIGTFPGATAYDEASTTSRIFTTYNGNSEVLVGGYTWTNIPYPSGWTKGGDTAPIGYRLVPGGVRLRGEMKRSDGKAIAKGTTLVTLPAAARPSYKVRVQAPGMGTGLGIIDVAANGVVKMIEPINRTSPYYFFDGIFLPQN